MLDEAYDVTQSQESKMNDEEKSYGFSFYVDGTKAELVVKLESMVAKLKDGTLFNEAVMVTEEQMQMMVDMPDHPSAYH